MFHRRRLQAPINSVKHYVHTTGQTVATATLASFDLVRAVVAPATANAFNVEEGSIVKAVYIELWIAGFGATTEVSTFTLIVEKEPGNGTAMVIGQALNLGAYPNKKNILYTTQGTLGAVVDGAQAVPIIRNFVLIPKGKQRMGLDDSIRIHIAAVNPLRICGIATYKEYR